MSKNTTTRTYNGYLIINWHDDDLRFRKTTPSKSDHAPTEYSVEVEIDVAVPEFDVPTLAAEFKVPEAQVRQTAASEVYAEGEPDGWHETVEDALDHFAAEAHGLDPSQTEFDDLVSTAVGYVMRRGEGLPPVAEVEEVIEERLENVANGGSNV
jgi:hypothetical protein